MIVKVQRSIHTNRAYEQMLIYNESRSVLFQGNIHSAILKVLDGRWKGYFEAHMEGTFVVLDHPVPDQDW